MTENNEFFISDEAILYDRYLPAADKIEFLKIRRKMNEEELSETKRRNNIEVRLKFLPTCKCCPLTPTIRTSMGLFILCKTCKKGYRLVYDITTSVTEKFSNEKEKNNELEKTSNDCTT